MEKNMNAFVVFGAGQMGEQALSFLGGEQVSFFIDNNAEKQNTDIQGKKVLSLSDAMNVIEEETIVIAVSEQYIEEIEKQLNTLEVTKYKCLFDVKYEITREKILHRIDYINVYNKAIRWINENIIPGEGIINNSRLRKSYPEVTGYYIPSLLKWGYKETAIGFAKWLCEIQHSDGSWHDTDGKWPYIFDSAQILKGLLAIRPQYPEVDAHIIKGCDWILGNMTDEGRLKSPLKNAWGDGKTFSEIIHIYCVAPIKEAGKIFNRSDYIIKADKIIKFYTTECKNEIMDFGLISHFYAYVMEALLDIGEVSLAKDAMNKIGFVQKNSGAVPAYKDVDWVCSTGLFQLALVWFRLGELEKGNKAFSYACKLQNRSGGWYGSYLSEENSHEENTYFPDAEISWANKYFLDALYYKNLQTFEQQSHMFKDSILKDDGRYQCVRSVIERENKEEIKHVLDAGCGKGCYLNNLVLEMPNNKYTAMDISLSVMEYLEQQKIEKCQGSLTNIPFNNDYFDIAFTCEALEHAVDISSAIKELCRVVKPGGQVLILDKNKEMLGYFDIEEWEQWFDEVELRNEMMKYCSNVDVIKNIDFDNQPANGLFYCWIGTVKG